ncbi:uncharacterized protein LOC121417157 [Lytechinus variegatus]|uniref:uncharacterized protein LOC121417157 n=1 Tax=Lytechinus variegatus TaxID=7654 RepID=UPI001BB24E6E|nr:uncharacterized protein LOC121417157 [Lytechinus variegatus]
MVKPTVFSVEQDPKKDKSSDVCLIPVKEVAYKSNFDDDQPLVTARSEVCTLQRCACAMLIILIGLGCLIGAGVGLYIHLNNQTEPTLIITAAGHPYGNDALYPPDFHRPSHFGGHVDRHMPDFHHGSRDRIFEPMRPPPPPPRFPYGHPPIMERPFGNDGLEPPFSHDALEPPAPEGPRTRLHERPMAPPGPLPGGPPRGRRPGAEGSRRLGPEYDLHHGGHVEHEHARRRGKVNRAHYHSNLP